MAATLNRVAFTGTDGLGRISVMCARCAHEVTYRLAKDGIRVVTKSFGAGKSTCELCTAELRVELLEQK